MFTGNRGNCSEASALMQVCALALLLCIACGSAARPDGQPTAPEPERLTLVTPENSTDTVISEVILTEAYRRLGIAVTIRKYPAERALRLADHGQVDGEVQRIDAVKTQYHHLIQVRPAINYLEAAVFSARETFEPAGWESLRPYRIGLIRGIKFAENNTVGMNRHLVSGYDPLFEMLERGRFDVVVTPRINGLYHTRRVGSEAIRELPPSIVRFDLYHYLHEKHADLVPRISGVLREMESSGELEMYRRHVIEVLLERAARGLPVCDEGQVCPELYALDRGQGGE